MKNPFQGTVDQIDVAAGLAYVTFSGEDGVPQRGSLDAGLLQAAQVGEGDDFEFFIQVKKLPRRQPSGVEVRIQVKKLPRRQPSGLRFAVPTSRLRG